MKVGANLDTIEYLRIVRRHWVMILSWCLIGVLAGALFSILTPPSYRAGTQLFVAIQGSGSAQDLQQGNTFTQARVQSYVQTVRTPAVLDPAIESLGLDVTWDELSPKVTASSDAKTVLLTVSVEDESPALAAALAQAIAASLISAVDELESPTAGGTSPVKLSVITEAEAPTAQASPNVPLNLLLGLGAGLILGLSIAVLRSALDTKIRGEKDLAHVTDAAILGGVVYDSTAGTDPLFSQSSLQSNQAESYRHIRTSLQFTQLNGKRKSILLTSSNAGEGKTTTAINIASAIADTGKKVALVDADLRRPMIATYLGLEGRAGLTTALIGEAAVDDLLQPWGATELYVLTSGRIPPNPSELLGSQAMADLLERLDGMFDVVIVDGPPLLPVTDSAVLAPHVGGVVLVVAARHSTKADLQKSISALGRVGSQLLGVVLNKLMVKGPDAYNYASYAYEVREEEPATSVKARRRGKRKRKRNASSMNGYHKSLS